MLGTGTMVSLLNATLQILFCVVVFIVVFVVVFVVVALVYCYLRTSINFGRLAPYIYQISGNTSSEEMLLFRWL